ncbi:substrate-binding domain-containing protein [Cohnella yongneupensis]|uniref:Substrate-binding domain-containing protein n=1 Tax=Cohnella yongneupensis TaxID=425006 RepID=A0ABW0QXT9_9BACL
MRNKVMWSLAAVVLLAAIGTRMYSFLGPSWSDKDRPILLVPKTIDGRIDFWQVLGQGALTAAKEFGEEVKTVGTVSESDVDGQIALLERALETRPKAIVLAASDYNRIVPVAKKIIEAGIPLITVDSGLNGGISESFIATDNYEAGKQAGSALMRWTGKDARIAIISVVKVSATAIEREGGARDSLKEAGATNVMKETYYSNSSETMAYQIVKKLIAEKPDLQGIVCLNEPTTVGAAKAVKEFASGKGIKMVGFDSSTDEVAFLEDDIIQAIVVQKPFNMGYLAVRTAVSASKGHKVESLIDTGSQVITKQNMYAKENQKLLFPFDGR